MRGSGNMGVKGFMTLDMFFESQEEPKPVVSGPNPVSLRPYQAEAVDAWFRRGKGIVEIPTGTGKTYLAMYIIWEKLREGKRVCVIVPTQYLAHQWKEKMSSYNFRNIGLYYANEKKLGDVTVFVYNSAIMNPEKVLSHDVIVIDEIHHFGAEGGLPLLKRMVSEGKEILGLTATLERADGRHEVIEEMVPKIYGMTVGQAIRQGYIVRTIVKPIGVDLTIDERMRYEELQEKVRYFAQKMDRAWSDEDYKYYRKRLMIVTNMRKQLTSEAVRKREKVYEIIMQHPGEKVIVFSESINTAEWLKKYLLLRGIKCETVHSRKSMSKRRLILKNWGKEFNVLLAVRSLDEGIDVPEVSVGIIVSSGLTTRQNVQRIGRLVRPRPGKTKAYVYVVYAKNTFEERLVRKIYEIVREDERFVFENGLA